jgi:hypothetical protein
MVGKLMHYWLMLLSEKAWPFLVVVDVRIPLLMSDAAMARSV